MGNMHRRLTIGLLLASAVGPGVALPAFAQTKVETEKAAVRGEKNSVKGYWITITDRTYAWEAFRDVVAIYRRVTDRWIGNLRSSTVEGSGVNETTVRSAASNVGYSTLLNYVQSNISYKNNGSNGIVLIDPVSYQIVGIIPVDDASDASTQLSYRTNRTTSATLKGGGTEDVRITGYIYHGSPVILDLEGLGRPDLLAGSEWKVIPGRKLASTALRAFDLDGSGTATWEWVGPRTGLLAWDPAGSGKIASGKQLFGNYTWGERFKDGYEPLARLDKDGDGQLAGPELEKLVVWVDTNSNAQSEPGEVLPVAKYGIESIAIQAQRDAKGHASVAKGFVRRTADGAKQALSTWDWIAMGKAKPTEGTYVWVGEEKGEQFGGYLRLHDDAGKIGGLSFPTVGQKPHPKYITALPITGRAVTAGKVMWTTPSPGGSITSEVTWDPGGKHLYGRTKVNTKKRKSEYSWQAELIAGQPIGAGIRTTVPAAPAAPAAAK